MALKQTDTDLDRKLKSIIVSKGDKIILDKSNKIIGR